MRDQEKKAAQKQKELKASGISLVVPWLGLRKLHVCQGQFQSLVGKPICKPRGTAKRKRDPGAETQTKPIQSQREGEKRES